MKQRILVVAMVLAIILGCKEKAPVRTKRELPKEILDKHSILKHVQNTGRLAGLKEVRVNEDGTVTFVDSDTGLGGGRVIYQKGTGNVKEITLEVGETFTLTDGRHAFTRYTLEGINDGRVSILIKDWGTWRGETTHEETGRVNLKPYRIENSQQDGSAPTGTGQ